MSKFDEILNSSNPSDALLGEQIDKLEQKTLIVKGGLSDKPDSDLTMMLAAVEESYTAAAAYSLFSGKTLNGLEGGWYGFKQTDTKISTAIMFSRGNIFHIIRENGTWKFKLISRV